ncbi:hypothetical protein [Acetobacter cibinongensis]|uniref:hypothetical protein n=1 Tax=Acetobacter cibinongensis TaxID=146475 RepID=UPI001F0A9430|nr:hypothetical protein [Acetobacter cibinongensis]
MQETPETRRVTQGNTGYKGQDPPAGYCCSGRFGLSFNQLGGPARNGACGAK